MSRMSEWDLTLRECAPYFVPPSPKLAGDAEIEALLAQMERKYVRIQTDATRDDVVQAQNEAALRDPYGTVPHVG